MTVVYVNGILTTYPEAKRDLGVLQTEYIARTSDYSTNFLTGYNESHIAGFGDTLQSIAQAFGTSITDFDRNTILMQIQPQVSTRKILLVGHSQGTFYTNSMYKYLTDNGVPKESIAVYNLATPADHVEGSGGYLTSTNDRVINGVRPLMAKYGALPPLAANIAISIPADEINDKNGGHHFGSSYLAMEPDRIVSDITNALGNLEAGVSSSSDGCFTPPPKTLGYKTQAAVFAIADPLSQKAVNGIGATGNAIVAAARKASAAAAYAMAQIRNIFASASSASGSVSAASQIAAISAASLKLSPATNNTNPPKTTVASVPTPPPAPVQTAVIPLKETPVTAPDSPPVQPHIQPPIPTPPVFGPELISVAPGFGGGGAGAPVPSPVAEAPAPAYVPLSVQAPPEGALFSTSSVTFTGTTTPGYSVVASYASIAVATVADTNGNWSIALTLPEGATAVGIVAADSAGNTSDAITRTVTIDTTPPGAPSPSLSECAASLSTSFCLISTTSATLAWPPVTGTAYYAYSINGSTFATTTETGVTLSLSPSASTTISVAAYDVLGNAATSTPVETYVLTNPIIINEVAWAGTKAGAQDKWIELKNISPYYIGSLSHVAIISVDGSPYLQLYGDIPPGGFYLIESRDESTSAAGNFITPLDALSQVGEELKLNWGSGNATTTLDRTPAVSVCGGWCPGMDASWLANFLSNPMTMERKATGSDGANAGSWQFGASGVPEATDSAGNVILGTPHAENSAGGIWPPLLFDGML
ncbi:MAG: hypothetical protein Q7S08_00650 [bacterium]|nr:hypothetical protein [bacterium]